jgi:hypothetical protein
VPDGSRAAAHRRSRVSRDANSWRPYGSGRLPSTPHRARTHRDDRADPVARAARRGPARTAARQRRAGWGVAGRDQEGNYRRGESRDCREPFRQVAVLTCPRRPSSAAPPSITSADIAPLPRALSDSKMWWRRLDQGHSLLRGTALSSFQEMHGKAAEAQVFISTDWIPNISIRGVALLVSEAIDRHRKKLHAILEILIDMGSRGPAYIKRCPLPKASDPVS